MDIEKLEKLSCLKLAQTDKEKIVKSLEGIFDMMKSLDNIETPNQLSGLTELTHLEKDIFNSAAMVKKEEKVQGLHIESGHFLAPKVIKK